MSSSIKYRPEIDGLRALAILPVIVFHLRPDWLPGGFVGVDVFFVISGYLITSIILKEYIAGVFTFQGFWIRRIRRIVPAMTLMLLVTLVAGYFILFSASWRSLGWQSLSTTLLSANIYMWHLTHGYWGSDASTLPLLHNWSLSVEEQFYLVFPFVLVICLNWFPRKLRLCLAIIFALSFGLCILLTWRFASAAFYFLPTRAWELAAGSLLATLANEENQNLPTADWMRYVLALGIGRWLAILGVAMMMSSWFLLNGTNFPGYIAVIPVIGTILVIQFAGSKRCLIGSLLSHPILRYIGRISYSLYLWHWPVIVLVRAAQVRWENIPTWPMYILIPLLAIVAYHMIELPGRKLRNPLPIVIPGVCAATALSAILIGMKPHYHLMAFEPTVWMGGTYDVGPKPIPLEGGIKARLEGITIPPRNTNYANAFAEGGILKQYGSRTLDVAVIGNSHALMWAPIIDEICKDLDLTVLFDAADGVDPFPDIPAERKPVTTFSAEEWYNFDMNRMKVLKTRRPRLIIVASRWSAFRHEEKIDLFLKQMCEQGSKILFIEDPPELAIGGVNAPQFISTTSATTIKARNPNEYDTSILDACARNFDCVQIVQTSDLYLNNEGRVKVREGNRILYIDQDHLSLAGARLAEKRICASITNILGKSVALSSKN